MMKNARLADIARDHRLGGGAALGRERPVYHSRSAQVMIARGTMSVVGMAASAMMPRRYFQNEGLS
jgi:hypothetical protein